ncbi:DoxX family protein [Streptomyces sp. NPDC054883]
MPLCHRKDLGLLALRLGTGGVLIAHGTQKLFGWFGGGGLEGTAMAMEHMGFAPARPSAIAAGLGEAGGGALLALGLATPAAGAAAAGAMAGAVSVHAPAGFFAQGGGFEYPAFLGFVAATLGLAGPGRLSLDHFTRHRLDRPAVLLLAFTVSAAAATVVVTRRNAAVAAAADRGPDDGA